MSEPEKRIVILEVYGGCRNIRFTDEGTYCAAYPHGGWEKIDPAACETCTREKHLEGKSRAEVLACMATALKKTITIISYSACLEGSEAILDALTGRNQ